jgi:hypothetical protein
MVAMVGTMMMLMGLAWRFFIRMDRMDRKLRMLWSEYKRAHKIDENGSPDK